MIKTTIVYIDDKQRLLVEKFPKLIRTDIACETLSESSVVDNTNLETTTNNTNNIDLKD